MNRGSFLVFVGLLIMFFPLFLALGDRSFATVGWIFMLASIPAGFLVVLIGFILSSTAAKKLMLIILFGLLLPMYNLMGLLHGRQKSTDFFWAGLFFVLAIMIWTGFRSTQQIEVLSANASYWKRHTRKQFREPEEK